MTKLIFLIFVATEVQSMDYWFGGDFGAGYQKLNSPKTEDDASKSGYAVGGYGTMQIRKTAWGDFSLGLGSLYASLGGKTSTNQQEVQTTNFIANLTYHRHIWRERVYGGGLIQTKVGTNSTYSVNDVNTTALLLSVGPQVEYRYPFRRTMEFIANVAVLRNLTYFSRGIWQIPVSTGFRLYWGNQLVPPIES